MTNELQSSDNSPIRTTRSGTGDRFTQEQKAKTVLFFNRLQLIYGRRFGVQWPDEKTLRLARREWAGEIDALSVEQLETALARAKRRLIEGDADFYWPDVGRILGLARERRSAAHRVLPPALPEGECVRRARQQAARRGMARVWQVLGGAHAQ
ncbi:hypothetical protein [uncultured Marinobacter sp.]|uniref:hypothetical protein n=1 Tax=uncultured Marinobacter sp. TaxID=187379 RepID=UPI0030DA79F3